MVSYRGVISIVSLVIYVPALPFACYLTIRYGFNRTAGWIFLVIFDLIRIVGASLQLATESPANARNIGLYTGAAVLDSVGLSPLFLTTVGLLLRLHASVHPRERGGRQSIYGSTMHYFLLALFLPIIVALILAIVGGLASSDNIATTGKFAPTALYKGAIILFTVAFALILVCAFIINVAAYRSEDGDTFNLGERYLLIAVNVSLPFLLIRLVYSLMVALSSNAKFFLISGDETATLTMRVLEEFVVVIVYTIAGFLVKKVAPSPAHERTPRRLNGNTGSPEENDSRPGSASPKNPRALKIMRHTPIIHWFIPRE